MAQDQAGEYGDAEAFRRLAGVPLALPDDLALDKSRLRIVADYDGLVRSPVVRAHLAYASRRAGKGNATTLFGEFLQHAAEDADLLATLLRWTEYAFQRDADWRGLPAESKLALVWAHADRICGIMEHAGVDNYQAAIAFFDENRPPLGIDLTTVTDDAYEKDCAAPKGMSGAAIVYHSLGYIFGRTFSISELTELQRSTVIELLSQPLDGSPFPKLGLLSRSAQFSNGLGAFLQERRDELFSPERAPEFVRANESAVALEKLEASVTDFRAWLWLVVFGQPELSGTQRSRLDAIYQNVSLAALSRGPEHVRLCRVAVDARRKLGGLLDDETLLRQIYELGRELATRYPTPVSLKKRASSSTRRSSSWALARQMLRRRCRLSA